MQKPERSPVIPAFKLHFSDKDIPKKYSVSKIVGKGSYGAVAIAKNCEDGKKVIPKHYAGRYQAH